MQEIDNIIRAWKDDDYRMGLTAEELGSLPENPAGSLEFSGAELDNAEIASPTFLIGATILGVCC